MMMRIIPPATAPTIIGMFVWSVWVSSPPPPSGILEENVGFDNVASTTGITVPPVVSVAPGVETTMYTAHNRLSLDHLLYFI